ncbi:Hsp70 family protein [Plantactinospora sp. BB1]|uniref:Hsp70 family protein n=1 Tax=Plantactinospora sp. BB1 TaxID=2071627 RepID=UPI000D15471D|nr:Hsp70 family protein [Plantactinospora sp. BB1]AVT35132.1 molecular chaperone Hsp70 [Plantactinospora sp. BB1]
MRLLAIDFGTSNTVAVVRGVDGRGRPLLFDGTPLLPSAVCLDLNGPPLTGRDAVRAARLDPARFEPAPKRRIDDGTVLLGDREVPVAELVGAVLRRVRVEADRQLGGVDEVRLTHPVRWGERRRGVLVAAARAAGLPPPRLVAEPVAAAAHYPAVLGTAVPPGRALAVYDLGGGTFDTAVVRRTAAGFDVLAESGLTDLGGLDFDQALVEQIGRDHAAGRTEQWHGLLSPVDPHQRRARELLYDDVRAAKELLSRAASAQLHLPALDLRAHLTREELESLIRRQLQQTVDCLARTIADARLDPADLVGIFLVGGSSRIPLAARLIHAELGVAPTTLEQPETAVAEGALRLDDPPAGPAHRPVPAGGDVGVPLRARAAIPVPDRAGVRPVDPAGRFWTGTAGLVWTGTLALLVVAALVVLVAVVTAGPG